MIFCCDVATCSFYPATTLLMLAPELPVPVKACSVAPLIVIWAITLERQWRVAATIKSEIMESTTDVKCWEVYVLQLRNFGRSFEYTPFIFSVYTVPLL